MRRLWLGSLALCTLITVSGKAAEGLSTSEIPIGVVNQSTGSLAQAGILATVGLQAAFERANRLGGVNGRKIRLEHHDNAWDPIKTAEITKKLLKDDSVFLITGSVGTATIQAAMSILAKGPIPFLFPRTGSRTAGEVNPYVFTLRATFEDEADNWMRYLKTKGYRRPAIIYQNDAFGSAVLAAAVASIRKAGLFDGEKNALPFSASVQLSRQVIDEKEIAAALTRITDAKADVILVGAAYPAMEKFIRAAKAKGKYWPVIVTSSTASLAESISDLDWVLFVTQVVPSPFDESLKLGSEFRDDLRAIGKDSAFGHYTFESYIAGRVITDALKRAGPQLTRAGLLAALEGEPFKFGTFEASFSKSQHNGHSKVYLTKVNKSKWASIDLHEN